MASIAPKPGFNWSAIAWGGPDEPASDHCSYCGDEIPEDSVPLILVERRGLVRALLRSLSDGVVGHGNLR